MIEKRQYSKKTKTLTEEMIRTLVDTETGETIHAQQIIKTAYGQKSFWKLYIREFINMMNCCEDKKMKVIGYIMDNITTSENLLIKSQREIAAGAGVSLDTVSRVIKLLQEHNFLVQAKRGVYRISPNLIMKGTEGKKHILLKLYNEEQKTAADIKRFKAELKNTEGADDNIPY